MDTIKIIYIIENLIFQMKIYLWAQVYHKKIRLQKILGLRYISQKFQGTDFRAQIYHKNASIQFQGTIIITATQKIRENLIFGHICIQTNTNVMNHQKKITDQGKITEHVTIAPYNNFRTIQGSDTSQNQGQPKNQGKQDIWPDLYQN